MGESTHMSVWIEWYLTSLLVQSLIFVTSILAVVLSILKTYKEELAWGPSATLAYSTVNAVILVIFAGDYVVNVYHAKKKRRFITGWVGLNNLLAILSVVLNLVPNEDVFLIVLHLNRRSLLRLIAWEVLGYPTDALTRELIAGVSGLLCFVLLCSSLVLSLERNVAGSFVISSEFVAQGFEWHTAVYFVIVTISTVGYGDISPSSDLAQISIGK